MFLCLFVGFSDIFREQFRVITWMYFVLVLSAGTKIFVDDFIFLLSSSNSFMNSLFTSLNFTFSINLATSSSNALSSATGGALSFEFRP